MSDRAELLVDGEVFSDFSSYSLAADIYTVANAFSLELINSDAVIAAGALCQLKINDQVELMGIIDTVSRSYDKAGVRLQVSGRDMMGVLIDSYCEAFPDVQNKTVKALAEQLLKNIPASHWPKTIVYQENFKGELKSSKKKVHTDIFASLDAPQKIGRIEPGKTVFEVLHSFALSRGMLFWCEADGSMVFGAPLKTGDADFSIICRKAGQANNIIHGELTEDVSKRWSKVTVITQAQGQNADGVEVAKKDVKKFATDKSYPFYKPFVETMSNDSQSPQLHADLRLKKMRHDGFQLSYRVPGHSQNNSNWAINRICQVTDEVLGLDDKYLLTARTFDRTKLGTFTTIKLSLL